MTQSNLLELAKQGDPQAIATLMNRTLHPKGMTATVQQQENALEIVLEAEQVPNRQALTAFVQNGINNLGLKSIQSIKIIGQQAGSEQPAWVQETILGTPTPAVSRVPAAPAMQPPPPPPPAPSGSRNAPATVTPEPAAADVEEDESEADTVIEPPLASEADLAVDPGINPGIDPGIDGSVVSEVNSAPIPKTSPIEDAIAFQPDAHRNIDLETTEDLAEKDLAEIEAPIEQPQAVDTSNLDPEPPLADARDNSAQPPLAANGFTLYDSNADQDEVSVEFFDLDQPSSGNSQQVEVVHFADTDAPIDDREPIVAEPVEPGSALMPMQHQPPPPRRSANSPWLFWLVLATLTAFIAAIIGYAFWREMVTPAPTPETAPAPEAPNPESPNPESPVPETAPAPQSSTLDAVDHSPLGDRTWYEAITTANQAVTLGQTARSAIDWQNAATQWQQAIALLESVPDDSPSYLMAQSRLVEYHNYLENVQQRANQATQASSSNTAQNRPRAVSCRAVAAHAAAKPIQLTAVQLTPSPSDASANQVVGCITNHSQRAIARVSVSYRGVSADNPQLFSGGFAQLTFAPLKPGQTLPFKSDFTVSQAITSLTIDTIYWLPPGTTELQEIETSTRLRGIPPSSRAGGEG